MAASDTGCSSSVGRVGHSAGSIAWWLDIIPGYRNRQTEEKTVLLGSSRILRSHVFCLDNHGNLTTSEAGFASGSYERP